MSSLPINNDAAALLGVQDEQPLFIYRVFFDMLVSIEEEEKLITLSDSLDVSAGRDVREAQDKVEQYVVHSGSYKIPAVEFYITGSKRLASTEI